MLLKRGGGAVGVQVRFNGFLGRYVRGTNFLAEPNSFRWPASGFFLLLGHPAFFKFHQKVFKGQELTRFAGDLVLYLNVM